LLEIVVCNDYSAGEFSLTQRHSMENGSDIELPLDGSELKLVKKNSEGSAPVTDLGIVTAKGTGSGLVLKIDPETEWAQVRDALFDFIAKRKAFLAGQSVLLDWQGAQRPSDQVQELVSDLRDRFQLSVRSALERVLPSVSVPAADANVSRESLQSLSIFDGMANFSDDSSSSGLKSGDFDANFKAPKQAGTEAKADWDDPDCRIFYKTLRSGQRIETEHSVVLVGDVNSGGEIVAGGDVIVLGNVRGVVHAGAFDETGGGRFIFAMDLNPTQLRIGSVISRGSSVPSKQPELARVDGNNIVVEPYSVKTVLARLNGI
jgi:septum site-determining protein MinC